eukprot:7717461-Pyramimonas_sp.AAC.1
MSPVTELTTSVARHGGHLDRSWPTFVGHAPRRALIRPRGTVGPGRPPVAAGTSSVTDHSGDLMGHSSELRYLQEE